MAEGTGNAGQPRVLVVDDDRELCELLTAYLEGENFAVECLHDGQTGLERAAAGNLDVLILDVMLPGLPGLEVLRRLRRTSALPVLMLTARGEEVDRIVGLELGADDYLPKPFNPRELVARIHAILRRTAPPAASAGQKPAREPAPPPPPIALGDLAVDFSRREASFAGQALPLTTVEFDVLCVLMHLPGRVVPRTEISRRALGRPYTPYDRSIDMHVMNLRRKLLSAAGARVSIKTVRSAGYMLIVEAAPSDPPSSGSRAKGRKGGHGA
jgi:DNA-binding response OmpR family regulator